MSKPTSIKTTEAVRDRLRVLAAERGTTITDLLDELAAGELTEAERAERAAAAAARELGVDSPHRSRTTSVWRSSSVSNE
ncbi:ribbon-helix-helix protein [Streptomyces sp. NPDC054775]